jgi:hypothetical protein
MYCMYLEREAPSCIHTEHNSYMLSRPASRAFCRVRASLGAACTQPWIAHVNKIGRIAWAGSLGGIGVREAGSSSSSTRWKTRQGKDSFAREARVQGLKSRAAFKLLEVSEGLSS